MYLLNPWNRPLLGVLDAGTSVSTLVQRRSLTGLPLGVRITPGAVQRRAAANLVMQAALDDERATDRALDQHYTIREVARHCVDIVGDHFDLWAHQIIEPSAGAGAFLNVLPPDTVGIDVDAKHRGIITADYLSIAIKSVRPVLTVGNPPFGKCSALAIRFFNRAATFSAGIGLVVPRTFRKAWVLRQLDSHFHLVREVELPHNAFLFRNKAFHVPALFQVWERREYERDLPVIETNHADFDFVNKLDADSRDTIEADFVVQRVGADAGRVHHNFDMKRTSHYFMRANVPGVEHRMAALHREFVEVAANTAGNPSLAKCELVALYRELTEGIPAFWRTKP